MGIDPGLDGGIAIIGRDGMLLEPMPKIGREIDITELNRLIRDHARDIRIAFVERPPIMPKNGAIALFKLGRSFGIIEGILVANGIAIAEVRPQVWMSAMHDGLTGKMETKDRSKLAFSRLFPTVDAKRTVKCKGADDGLVEAALIAEYGRRITVTYNL